MNPMTWYRNRQTTRANDALWRALVAGKTPPESGGVPWDPDGIEAALAQGADPNALAPREQLAFMELEIKKGWRPLHRAVHADNPTLIRLLLAKGADPTLTSEDGRLPVSDAADRFHSGTMALLLDAHLAMTGHIDPDLLAALDRTMARASKAEQSAWATARPRFAATVQAQALDDLLTPVSPAPSKARPRL